MLRKLLLLKPFFTPHGQSAAVVKVGMREHNGIDALNVKRKFAVQLSRFLPPA